MEKYTISLIVPVYNKEKYLKKSLDSMVKQSYEALEIILVDDGSTDKSLDILRSYEKDYGNVKVLSKENGGPSSAWKAGFKISEGQYIAFADSDDWIDLDMIELMAANLTGQEKEMVLCDHTIDYDDGRSINVYQPLKPGNYERSDIEKEIIPNLLGNEKRIITMSRCMKLIERSLIEENADFCDSSILMGDDSTIILPCILDAERIYSMDHKAMYHYLYVSDSVVHRYDPKMFDNNTRLVENYKNTISTKLSNHQELMEKLLKGADGEYIYLLFLVIKNEARGNMDDYISAIKKVCRDPKVRCIVKANPVSVTEKSNMLIYSVLKHPSTAMILLLRLAMKIYYH